MIRTLNIRSIRNQEIIDITHSLIDMVEKSGIDDGECLVFVPHTTAGVTINENADPDVKKDLLLGMDKMVPTDIQYDHAEGNSRAHIKASMTGSSVSLIINNGKILLGVWQGVYFCEFDGPRTRKVMVRIKGESR